MQWSDRTAATGMSRRGKLHVLGIAASLRHNSYNRRLLIAAADCAGPGMSIVLDADLAVVPLYNEDVELAGVPDGVARLAAAVARSDAVIIATPEYNQSMPGVAKNMIDWLSRIEPAVLERKALALMGVTTGSWGTRLAQAALRQTLAACGALVMSTPQIHVRGASTLFDKDRRLIDEATSIQLKEFLEAFAAWVALTAASPNGRP